MNKRILSPDEVKRLAYEEAKVASDAHALDLKIFSEEEKADGGVTRLGRRSQRVRKPRAATFAFLNNTPSLVAIIVGEQIRIKSAQLISDTAKALWQKAQTNLVADNDTPTTPITYSTDFNKVSQDVAQAVEKQIHYELKTVEKIAEGSFMGPHPEQMHKLVEAFHGAQIGKEEFTRQALNLRGVIFSQEHGDHALCARKFEDIRAQFNATGKPQEPVSLVLVYREQVSPEIAAKNPDQPIIAPKPEELHAA